MPRRPQFVRLALIPLLACRQPAVEREDLAGHESGGIRAEEQDRTDEVVGLGDIRPSGMRRTAFYAGLRLGELRALRWKNVDLASGVIRVEEALDHKGETIAPKSRSRRRIVPIVGALPELLLDLKLESASDYVFGRAEQPFSPSSVYLRARRAWRKAGLEGIGLHEARHTCASVMIAAGVNAKAITHYLGHSSIEVTFDRYGHLMPGNEAEAVALIDAYLERANTLGRLAALDQPS